MSSVLTKTTISGLVTLACSGYSIQNLGCINSAIQNNKVAFFGTYGAMVAYDIYDYFKGDIQTITMKDSEGNFIEKEY